MGCTLLLYWREEVRFNPPLVLPPTLIKYRNMNVLFSQVIPSIFLRQDDKILTISKRRTLQLSESW